MLASTTKRKVVGVGQVIKPTGEKSVETVMKDNVYHFYGDLG